MSRRLRKVVGSAATRDHRQARAIAGVIGHCQIGLFALRKCGEECVTGGF